ncbi:MAG: JDVT-CTERM domain-containing protein [Gammaproteobacteria bacterium]
MSDQRGATRVNVDGNADTVAACDSGAYERQVANTDMVLNGLVLSASSMKVGEEITITVSAGNTGPATATSARVDVALPDQLSFVSGAVTGGATCTTSGNKVSCALGDMAASASSNISVIAAAVAAGTVSISANISALEVDSVDTTNNSAQAALTINPKPVITSSDNGGGFCAYNPNGKLDLVLPAILFVALGALGWRRKVS